MARFVWVVCVTFMLSTSLDTDQWSADWLDTRGAREVERVVSAKIKGIVSKVLLLCFKAICFGYRVSLIILKGLILKFSVYFTWLFTCERRPQGLRTNLAQQVLCIRLTICLHLILMGYHGLLTMFQWLVVSCSWGDRHTCDACLVTRESGSNFKSSVLSVLVLSFCHVAHYDISVNRQLCLSLVLFMVNDANEHDRVNGQTKVILASDCSYVVVAIFSVC